MNFFRALFSSFSHGHAGRGLLSSVTRWLLVVVGCAVLETVQPMIAAESTPPISPSAPSASPSPAAPAGLEADRILYPADARPSASDARERASSGVGPVWAFVLLVGLGVGAVWVWRRRNPVAVARRRGGILIEDTRALGNRQFLVVAGVDGRRFLLGVAPGSIRLLSPLDSGPGVEPDDHDDA